MGSTRKTNNFFHEKPLFGLDIGKGSVKIVEIEPPTKGRSSTLPKLRGYGFTTFNADAIQDGIVVQPEMIAAAIQDLFKKNIIGDITTHRVALAIPSYRTFTRSIILPPLKPHERAEAVRMEAEQYIPLPIDDLYLDFSVIRETPAGTEVLAVAIPKQIVDSYLDLCTIMGLEPILIEATITAIGRMFSYDPQGDVSSVILDMGTLSSDISIYDEGIVTSGTVQGGGQVFTATIEKKLNVTSAEAHVIKNRYGMGKSRRQSEITQALDPILGDIVKEVKRLIRYHDERYSGDRTISQIVLLGGGANMPGLSEYLTNHLRIATRTCNPWSYVDMRGIQPPHNSDQPMYATAVGLALAPYKEVLQ